MRKIAMMRKSIWNAAAAMACLALAAGLAGCRINVDKGSNGEDKHVQVDTPFGGIHVNTDETSAADLGLPVYPGAQPVNERTSTSLLMSNWALANGRCACVRFPMPLPIPGNR
jgi:hypothetical protein